MLVLSEVAAVDPVGHRALYHRHKIHAVLVYNPEQYLVVLNVGGRGSPPPCAKCLAKVYIGNDRRAVKLYAQGRYLCVCVSQRHELCAEFELTQRHIEAICLRPVARRYVKAVGRQRCRCGVEGLPRIHSREFHIIVAYVWRAVCPFDCHFQMTMYIDHLCREAV